MSTTYCDKCGGDPCTGTHMKCDLYRYYLGNDSKPAHLMGMTEPEYQVERHNFLMLLPGPYSVAGIEYDYVATRWVLAPQSPTMNDVDHALKEICKKKNKARLKRGGSCECGVWATGGLHSDWCPNSSFDRAFKEDR